jgi:hypothetical protein
MSRSNAKIRGSNDCGRQRLSADRSPRPAISRPLATRLDRFRCGHQAAYTAYPPDCRKEHPHLLAAAAADDVPLVIHDFPIQRHLWAFPAALLARYFEAVSPALGAQFRSYIFQDQPGIGVDNFRRFGEQFASSHGLTLPGNVDPDGKLAAGVQADYGLGTRIGLEYVPLIFVVGRGEAASRWVEVTETATLGIAIEQMRRDVRGASRP